MESKKGETSWLETHFEIVSEINSRLNNQNSPVFKMKQQHGHTILYELAEVLTDKFETKYQNYDWDGEFIDEIEKFAIVELDFNLSNIY